MVEKENEQPPTHESIKILDYETISKNANWWSAVVKGELFGKVKTMLFLWHMEKGSWKRKQKFTVPSPDNWNDIDAVVRKFMNIR